MSLLPEEQLRRGTCIIIFLSVWLCTRGVHCTERCKTNCQTCDQASSRCNVCAYGYYADKSGLCRPCAIGCQQCKNQTECSKCVQGYFLEYYEQLTRNYCAKCSGNCLSCSNWTVCDECIVGFYGKTCNSHCSTGCQDGSCNKDNGECSCLPFFEGNKCDLCLTGYSGENCDIRCSNGCQNSGCSKSGICSCKTNFIGSKCDTCFTGYYGNYCQEKCSLRCKFSSCNKDTGNCQCQPNFTGNNCETCLDGFYGNECNSLCSYGCQGKYCYKDTGTCECKPNFTGSKCDTCLNGKYGTYCNNNCSLGCSGLCDENNGHCRPCRPNFSGDLCNTCIDGRYGQYCDQVCMQNCESCSNDNSCRYCKQGFYGKACLYQCPNNCLTCNSDSICLECKLGFYGNICQNNCSVGCGEKQCKQSDAACSPCVEGYRGNTCSNKCSDGCEGGVCDQYYAKCTSGCKEGTFGLSCDQTCPGNCLICTAKSNCQKCKDGYFVNYGMKCQQCHNNCETCTSWEQCSTCKTGFVGQQCHVSCPDHCLTCNQSRSCLTCKPGFTRQDKQCECFDSLCGDSACAFCTNSSYYVNNHTCCPCNSRCKYGACTSASECTYGCEDGFFGAKCEFNCIRQDGNCLICYGESNHAVKCTKCNTGFFPNTYGQCTRCSTSCLDGVCNSSNGHCDMGCKEAYWNTMCETPCKNNCSICDQNTGTCLTCSSLSVYGVECNIPCNNNCINQLCHPNGTCINGCISNYFGKSCDTPCPTNCAENGSESRCSLETGLCLFGCSAGFTGDGCTEAIKQESYADSGPAAAIGGGVAAVVVLAIVITVGIFMCIRKRNREPKTELVHEQLGTEDNASAPVYATVVRSGKQDKTCMVHANTSSVEVDIATPHDPVYTNDARHLTMKIVTTEESLEIDELDNIARQNAIRFEENGGVYYNNDSEVKKCKLPISELQKFVMSKNRDYFKTEFEKLPYGLLKDYSMSQMKSNIAKNRYKGIYPYDDHRVRVLGGDTDYINASFIDGFKRRNEYIATLGPMSKQLGDLSAFWRMVWQQKVEKIVMVTNLVEEGTDKCEQYWPNEGSSRMFGDVRVVGQSENHHAEFTRRKFTIEKDTEERTLHHLHFTAWPDKDVPDDVTSIIEFRQNVLDTPSTLGGPTIVHCSAGIGRTGTYIAIDILINEGKSQGAVDIAGCVLNMRQNRPNMIQTAGQYEYLHNAVVHALTFDRKPE